MAISLAVKYRPKTWNEVTEQHSVVRILQNQLTTGMIKNAYAFCGASGCGKTTLARIFASEINNHQGNPIEIDAASNNGVDNVRNIIQSASERSLDSTYKIFILDEAHMLSTQAWNAMLKLIEEPPKYTIFIFCTTDPQKIPNTILNRVQRYNLTRISSVGIHNRLKFICDSENIRYDDDALDYIARISNGGMRDAISLLDKCTGYSEYINNESVLNALGNYSYDVFFKLINCMIDGKEQDVLSVVGDYYNAGNDLSLFVDQFFSFVLDVSKYAIFKSCELTKLPTTYTKSLEDSTNFDGAVKYYGYVADKLLTLKQLIKGDSTVKETVEVILLQITRCQQ